MTKHLPPRPMIVLGAKSNYQLPMPKKLPTITDTTLVPIRAIELLLKEDPGVLDRPDCTYSPANKVLLKRLVGQPVVAKQEYSDEDLEKEISDLYSSVRNTQIIGDTKDTISLFKTQADLLSRLVEMRAKIMNVRDMARFQRTVVEILDGLITPAQRNEFIERLGKHVR